MPFIVKFSYMYIFLNIFTLIIPNCSPPTPDYLLFPPWQAQSCASQHASGSASLTASSHPQDSYIPSPLLNQWACIDLPVSSVVVRVSMTVLPVVDWTKRVIWKEEPQLRKCLHQTACRSALISFFPICGLTFSVML